MTKSITTIVSDINKLTAQQKEFIAYRYDAILFNNESLMFEAEYGCLPQFQEKIVKLLERKLFREVIIEHIFLYEIKFCENKLENIKLAEKEGIQDKTAEIKILKAQYQSCISTNTINNINQKTKIKTLLHDYYSATLNSIQCNAYLDSLQHFACTPCDSYEYDSYNGSMYLPEEDLKEWEKMQKKNDDEIERCIATCKALDAQYTQLHEEFNQ